MHMKSVAVLFFAVRRMLDTDPVWHQLEIPFYSGLFISCFICRPLLNIICSTDVLGALIAAAKRCEGQEEFNFDDWLIEHMHLKNTEREKALCEQIFAEESEDGTNARQQISMADMHSVLTEICLRIDKCEQESGRCRSKEETFDDVAVMDCVE